ncbi:hypothetical protein [Marinobacter sp. NSM]|uniref:hypothetical protein n=1 Tax=Marinobacter sp. NSM TaxID=3458004 RepID=UPI0040357D36
MDLTDTNQQRALLYLRTAKYGTGPVAVSHLQDEVARHRYEAGSAKLSHVLPAIQRSLGINPDQHQATPPKLSRGRIGYQGD